MDANKAEIKAMQHKMGADQAKIVAIEEHMRAKTDDCLEEMKAN
jgi:hypothetical protein